MMFCLSFLVPKVLSTCCSRIELAKRTFGVFLNSFLCQAMVKIFLVIKFISAIYILSQVSGP